MRGRPIWRLGLLAVSLLLTAAAPKRRETFGPPPPPTPYDLCETAIAEARPRMMPPALLPAIARVESGRFDPVAGRTRPWPWTINVEGIGSFYNSKDDVIAAVQATQAKGIRSIDVGCMQVNLLHHPTAFADLATAFDPSANAAYAVRFLSALYGQTHDWNLATAMYHSQTQERGEEYQRLVFGRVMTPMGPPPAPRTLNLAVPNASVFGAIPPSSAMFGAIPPPSLMFGAFGPVPAAPARR